MVNNEGMYVHAKAVSKGMMGLSNVSLSAQILATEDFRFNAEKVHVAFFGIGVHNIEEEEMHHVHTPVPCDRRGCAALHNAVAIEFLNKHPESIFFKILSNKGICTSTDAKAGVFPITKKKTVSATS
ncbi:hypothetical protein ACQ4PT_021700 [Festuca glaucescens]